MTDPIEEDRGSEIIEKGGFSNCIEDDGKKSFLIGWIDF
jgi:hypothetical protein